MRCKLPPHSRFSGGYCIKDSPATYKSVSFRFSGDSVVYNHGLLNLSELEEIGSQRLVRGVVRQSADEQFRERVIFLKEDRGISRHFLYDARLAFSCKHKRSTHTRHSTSKVGRDKPQSTNEAQLVVLS